MVLKDNVVLGSCYAPLTVELSPWSIEEDENQGKIHA